MDDTDELLQEEKNVDWNEAPMGIPQENLGGGGKKADAVHITPQQADNREDKATALRKGGARRDENYRLEITRKQLGELAKEARADIAKEISDGTRQKDITIDIEDEDDSSEIVDPQTKEAVRDIVASIQDRAVFGKWKHGGEIPSVGSLPSITIPPSEGFSGTRDLTDFIGYPKGSMLAGDGKSIASRPDVANVQGYLSDYYRSHKSLPEGWPGHFIMPIPMRGGERVILDYITFETNHVAGRQIGLVHHLYEMPAENATQLMQLIETNADAAEEFNRQATGSTENKGNIKGEGRITSSSIGIVDIREMAKASANVTRQHEYVNCFKNATTKKEYAQPYGEA